MINRLIIISLCMVITSCSLSVSSLSENLNKAMVANEDPYTVREALPTYIILIDSLIEDDEDEDLYRVSSEMLNAYASLIAIDADYTNSLDEDQVKIIKSREKKLVKKSLLRASRAMCLYEEVYCNIRNENYAEFKVKIDVLDEDDIAYAFSLAQAWLSWLRLNSDDWNVTAKIPHIKYLFEKVIEKNRNWQNGAPYMYLGVLNSLMPANLGGKPEIGENYFIEAEKVSQGKNLMIKVLYAEYYARLVFNQTLHDELLNSVINSENSNNEFSLMNTIAKMRATRLLRESGEYF